MKHTLTLFLVAFLFHETKAQLQEACIRVNAGFVNTSQAGAVQTPDGGFVMAGRRDPINTGFYHMAVTKLDADGVLQWMKYFVSGSGIDWPKAIINTADGGLAVAGASDNMGARGFFILKLDANGNEQWTKAYTASGFSLILEGDGFIELADGGFAAICNASTGLTTWFFIRTDANGDVIWSDHMGFSPNTPMDVAELPNGDLVYTGWNADDPFIMRKDGLTGDTEWMNWYTTDSGPYEEGYAITVGPDSTIVMAGLISLGSGASNDAFAFAVEADGDPLWFSRISAPEVERANDITVHPDGGYVLTGKVNLAANTINGVGSLVARLDDAGQLLWSKLITSSDPLVEWTTNVAIAADGGILLSDEHKQLMVKVDNNGNSCPYCPSTDFGTYASVNATIQADQAASAYGPWATPATLVFTATDITAGASYSNCGVTSVDELLDQATVTIAPNPFSNSTVVTIDPKFASGGAWIELRDVLGRLVHTERIQGSATTIAPSGLSDGSYSCSILNELGRFAEMHVQVLSY